MAGVPYSNLVWDPDAMSHSKLESSIVVAKNGLTTTCSFAFRVATVSASIGELKGIGFVPHTFLYMAP